MKKVLKVILGLIVVVIVGGMLSSDGSDSKSSETKPFAAKIEWNMNLEDEDAATANSKLCIKAMKQMENVADNAKPVSAPDVVANPAQYVGQVLEFSVAVVNVENMPSGSNGEKLFGGKGHAMEAVDYGVYIIAFRKGDISKDVIGKEFKIIGMLAGVQQTDDMGKALLIIGNPK